MVEAKAAPASGSGKPARAIPLHWLLLFWLASLAFLLRFADRDFYEGDDVNSILPMAHLEAAKQGLLLIYRYAWQPLSYELGAAVWRLSGTPTAVFLLAPIAGATGLALLLWWLAREARTGARLLPLLCILLAVPELCYSALYFNSTILGMPLLALALLLVRIPPLSSPQRKLGSPPPAARAPAQDPSFRWGDGKRGVGLPLLAGILTGLAVLMRMDFILICPLLAIAAWRSGGSLKAPIALAAGVVLALLAGYALGLVDPAEILKIQTLSSAEIRDRAHEPGWDFRSKLLVLSVALSPVGWLMLLLGLPLLLLDSLRRRDLWALGWAAAALPAVYPLTSMLSDKYILPLVPFLLLFFLRAQESAVDWLGARWRAQLQMGLALIAVVPVFLSVSLQGHAPYLAPGLAPVRPVNSHDGPRGYGGYLWQWIATDAPDQQTADQIAARQLADRLLAPTGSSMLLIGSENVFDPGGIGWRHLQLILERRGVHGRLIAPHELQFDVRPGRSLILADEMPKTVPAGYEVIDKRK